MVIDMNYWTKVFRKLVLLILSFITIYLSFKLAFFYMPFLIAFVISLLLEPAIRFFMRKRQIAYYRIFSGKQTGWKPD